MLLLPDAAAAVPHVTCFFFRRWECMVALRWIWACCSVYHLMLLLLMLHHLSAFFCRRRW
jgi:hypothetical protein